MATVNIVYAGNHIHGMIGDDLIDTFREQRNVKKNSYYTIHKINKSKITKEAWDDLRYAEAFLSTGEYVMFPSEEEFMLLSLDQFLTEMQDVFKEGIELLQYLKLSPEENQIIHEFLYDSYTKLKGALPEYGEEEDDFGLSEQIDVLDRSYMEAWILGLVDKTVRREL